MLCAAPTRKCAVCSSVVPSSAPDCADGIMRATMIHLSAGGLWPGGQGALTPCFAASPDAAGTVLPSRRRRRPPRARRHREILRDLPRPADKPCALDAPLTTQHAHAD